MLIFATLVLCGLVFMVYALVQFHRELKWRGTGRGRSSYASTEPASARRVLEIRSKTDITGWSQGKGKLSSTASAVMAMCLFAGSAQAASEKTACQEGQEAPAKQADAADRALPITIPRHSEMKDDVQEEASDASVSSSQGGQSDSTAALTPDPVWFYGAFVDAGYLLDFNHPANDLFRSRGTAYKVDYPLINMAGACIRKTASESSRWGMELTVQAGQDSRVFGFSSTAPNLPGYEGLRHLGPTDVSYVAPVGKGLTIQGGIFSSLIGYDSLYAKDNFSYTRPWGADFTPYLMIGVNASYPFTAKLTGTVFLVNGYWHLANANHVPSWGSQAAYKMTSHTTLKETVLIGPHQSDTSSEFWRFLWDSILERKTNRLTIAIEYHVGTEKLSEAGDPRALWMAAQLPFHWVFNKHWSATVRPEVYWDRDGRLTGFRQTVKANTTTLEYRLPYRDFAATFRLEHRIDDSRGPQGGFFRGGEIAPGVVALTPTQNLLILGVILTFDSHLQP